MASEEKPRCGICRKFFPTGAKNENGFCLGRCDEFPVAGLINENCCCHGERTPFRRKENGNVK